MLDLPAGETFPTSWFFGVESGLITTSMRLLSDESRDPSFPVQTTSEYPAWASLLQRDGGIILGRLPRSGVHGPLKRFTASEDLDSTFVENTAITDLITGLATAYDMKALGYSPIRACSDWPWMAPESQLVNPSKRISTVQTAQILTPKV